MVKKTFMLCLFASIIFCSSAQFIRHYMINLPKYYSPDKFSEYWLHLKLCENGNYEISSDNYNGCLIMSHYISEGKYEIHNDTILLTDSYTQHQLLYRLNNTSLIPIKTYPFMKEIVFKDYNKICRTEKNNIGHKIPIEKRISNFEKTNTQNNHFEEGIYVYKSIGARFEMKFDSEKKYEFSFKLEGVDVLSSNLELYLIFFTGTWECKGNILTLWDTNFQHQFYGLIREDGIEILVFPIENIVFRKE